ncbi:MAG TPA: pectate lyase [Polyangiaceae bacterium]|nr:pectate lyase [Polyangiaceae bacterium]
MVKLSRFALACWSIPLLLAACGGGAGSDLGQGNGAAGGAAGSATSSGGSVASAGSATASGGSGAQPTGSAGTPSAGAPSGGAPNGSAGQNAGGGSGAAGGKAGSAGSPGTAGGGSGGSTQTGTYGPSPTCKAWPAAMGSTQKLSKTMSVSKDFDGKLQRFVSNGLGDGGQSEGQSPLFELADGATLENVIIGAPAADGIHCLGSCSLKNVWWEDVGEDAATLKGSSSSQVMSIDCGGAMLASDKVFQHDGPGTMKISNFYVQTFGKLYRSCGNCSKQSARHVVLSGISALAGSDLAGVNENYNDTATFSNILVAPGIVICQRYTGNDTGAEPPATGSGPDGKVCIYQPSDIHNP